jgi:hypothetical protein
MINLNGEVVVDDANENVVENYYGRNQYYQYWNVLFS